MFIQPALCVFFVFLAVIAAQRLVFHPLRKLPGPLLAAASGWYTAYYNICQGGKLVEHLEALHAVYGPIVRIGPNEVHFSDPRAYYAIYSRSSRLEKDRRLYDAFQANSSLFGTPDWPTAKALKDTLSPLFSRRAILKLETVIQDKADKLISRLTSFETSNVPANLYMAFRSTSLDVIMSYCFSQSFDALEHPNFSHRVLVSMESTTSVMIWIYKHFPFLRLLASLPSWMLPESQKGLSDLRQALSTQVAIVTADPDSLQDLEHESIYHHLLARPTKGLQEAPSHLALLDEAQSLAFAGSLTVGNACIVASLHILTNTSIWIKLARELVEVWPDQDVPVEFEALEKLPYLTAVIKEALRMSHGVATPLPRIVGPSALEILGCHIPSGTVVSMGVTFIHNNSDIFSDPFSFDPERWLGPNAKELEPHLVAFSKGPRSCIGINLAWCELYILLANVFRKLELTLDGATVDDIKFRDYFTPAYVGKPVHAFVKRKP
ncbi:hypothetical protein PLICRDRAFT_119247 [Plicaturopsis crispa FD-325 SS-3]|uniref:Unplaced genomic scaffold PLICRscaffold_22, whole genome shotgun sequence n=1 Tax=Plicaturopsis crispa FD-325 SS-3 TaxID=944288 RepID=A0A0C9SWE2_PLICR|nr:hypothetical protein PLICRDRAFT_119247 [Plicaturopsis crispa FD-325 SS-3]